MAHPISRRSFLGMVGAAALATGCAADITSGPQSPPATSAGDAAAVRDASPTTPRPATQISHGPRDSTSVALTFHGQGDPALAEELLAIGERAQVPLTVFAVGSWLQQYPQMAQRILRGGHELGNHTMNHLPMASMGADEADREFQEAADVLLRTSGSIGTHARPSGTQFAQDPVLRAAARAGYSTVVSYDVDSLDYTDPGSTAVVDTTLAAVRGGSIISLHFGHSGTVEALPQILTGLRTRSLQPVTVTQLLNV